MKRPDDPPGGLLRDLSNACWIKVKAALFVFAGLLAAALLLIEHPSLIDTVLLLVCVWSFCRAYYFAFYVIEHYVDPAYKFSGLGSFVRYWWRERPKATGVSPRTPRDGNAAP